MGRNIQKKPVIPMCYEYNPEGFAEQLVVIHDESGRMPTEALEKTVLKALREKYFALRSSAGEVQPFSWVRFQAVGPNTPDQPDAINIHLSYDSYPEFLNQSAERVFCSHLPPDPRDEAGFWQLAQDEAYREALFNVDRMTHFAQQMGYTMLRVEELDSTRIVAGMTRHFTSIGEEGLANRFNGELVWINMRGLGVYHHYCEKNGQQTEEKFTDVLAAVLAHEVYHALGFGHVAYQYDIMSEGLAYFGCLEDISLSPLKALLQRYGR